MMNKEILDQIPDDLRTASQARLVVMIYDEAIGALRAAAAAIEAGDIEARCNEVTLASGLVAELYMSLDMEKGGEIADNLARLYTHVLARFPKINIDNDASCTQEIIAILEPLRDSWRELDDLISAGTVPGHEPIPAFSALLSDDADDSVQAAA